MKVEGRWRRTIELADDRRAPVMGSSGSTSGSGRSILVLDQAKLPYEIAWLRLGELADVARAIRDMHVRGAPLIGATAACGVAIALHQRIALDEACATLAATRPTAINLAWALGEMRAAIAR